MKIENIKNRNIILPVSIGFVYLWFGLLKFFPHASPAEGLAIKTVDQLSFGLLDPNLAITTLAFWETLVGIMLIVGIYRRITLCLAIMHILLTFTPALFFPEEVFNGGLLQLTLLGQYIAKNVIILGSFLYLWVEKKEQRPSLKIHSYH